MVVDNMKVAVLGSNGFIGSEVSSFLQKDYQVIPITRESYSSFINESFDVLVNCNGNSKKFWANENRKEDFILSVQSVYNSLFDFKYKKYIYISSMDILHNSIYGYHKSLAENLISYNISNYAFLRCPSVIGKNMKKGVVKDILENRPLFIHPNSKLKVITNTGIAKIVSEVINLDSYGPINIGSIDTISIDEIATLFDRKVTFSDKLEYYDYNFSLDKRFTLKTAKEYLKELI